MSDVDARGASTSNTGFRVPIPTKGETCLVFRTLIPAQVPEMDSWTLIGKAVSLEHVSFISFIWLSNEMAS